MILNLWWITWYQHFTSSSSRQLTTTLSFYIKTCHRLLTNYSFKRPSLQIYDIWWCSLLIYLVHSIWCHHCQRWSDYEQVRLKKGQKRYFVHSRPYTKPSTFTFEKHKCCLFSFDIPIFTQFILMVEPIWNDAATCWNISMSYQKWGLRKI